MRRLLIALALALMVAPALAHDPDIEDEDWGLYDDPYIILDTSISYALYGIPRRERYRRLRDELPRRR